MKTADRTKLRIGQQETGSAFLVTIILITVLALVAARVCFMLNERYRYTFQANSWQEASFAAESGADIAMATLKSGVWTGWNDQSGNTVSTSPPVSTQPPPATAVNVYKTIYSHNAGEGSSRLAVTVQIDAPSGLADSSGQWYRIRSTGVSEMATTMHLGYEPSLLDINGHKQAHSNLLRKFSFTTDKSSGQLNLPQTARSIEVIAQPATTSPWTGAITLANQMTMVGGSSVDSFDSSNPAKSTSGQYDVTKRQSHGDISIIQTNGSSDFNHNYVYGNLNYNGVAVADTDKVQGAITTPNTKTIQPVAKPTWTVYNPTPVVINAGSGSSTTLTSGPAGSPQRYKLTAISITGGHTLTIQNPNPGQERYAEIWITGDFDTSGTGIIHQQAGVHITYYVEGHVDIAGSSVDNQSGVAANNILYGVGPLGAISSKVTITGGSGSFVGAVDAPNYKFSLTGGASIIGALIGNTMSMTGSASVIHYDEALARFNGAGMISGYKVASWIEDVR